ncbi:hypothetical protein A3E97_03910 [Candidatus Uhrbacteria bacterium RIFCSPHIGHO2_12_FULL_47_12]|uniref:Nudix hydrolase domain-containing protein n=1 Tax=Candidatus Uhrbacteria bacterium RIFCSPLOWO2_02_FULL_48_18 TaxID=1802408 RepID=A0A1F7V9A4_9BACT|nr:MAG: hypothetical protein A2839_03520 [Candidatus Uhrbacteria bacterium RIFCSPHIGHO2_01_FULL_47_10]OGL75841.1 MAG: hypothetical protein A3E97_03910 [Candidatus Uhrbacteria bacterium RIFCSPHIGHO2_12_FULL_47_12]OGL81942.1 MAG: hypothetical protein A3B20_02565 [Candidatus Uhrbacteria bacterium RIFCSPLOWO2_01_FULL_47_17]OGL87106.1 MAG: hypothetical protein A3I41_04160 [Candidatus Uhrbacteria bacterium RIFCSPLOWO2_02_FULL_48_18]OGL93679.1 MAG: hypothetical protein A3H12_03455 [Candidatus Uhrbacte
MQTEHYRSLVAVYVMAVNDREEILLLRRANTGYRDGFYDMPAGHLEEGETLRQAALRELKEETGLVVSEDQLEFMELLHRMSGDRVYLDVFFEVKQWNGEACIMEPEKCDHLAWFPLGSLPENIVPHQHQVLQDRSEQCAYREIWESIV